MKKSIIKIGFVLAWTVVAFYACRKSPTHVQQDLIPLQDVLNTDYKTPLVTSFSSRLFAEPNLNNEKVGLGRALFYDPRLSLSGAVACASCHKQNIGFSDDVAFSMGFKGLGTNLNSLPLSNLVNTSVLFWENRATSLEQLSLMPVANHIEMGFVDIDDVMKKLNGIDWYQENFKKIYSEINTQTVSNAIAQFLSSLRSSNSKFDVGYNGQITNDYSNFTPEENLGKQLFFSKYQCGSCHGSVSKINTGWSENMSNIGLPKVGNEQDYFISKNLKVPSLRNIALTAPYMHDGRFTTLDEVIDHYSHGITMNSSLSWQFRDFNGGAEKAKEFNITTEEKSALIAFLHTLTDNQFVNDKRFSNPFLY